MEIELTKQELEAKWFEAYYLLSNAGFDIWIDEMGDSSMTVSHRDYEMTFGENGMMLVKTDGCDEPKVEMIVSQEDMDIIKKHLIK